MYQGEKENNSLEKTILLFDIFKICIALILLLLGGYLLFWIVETTRHILNNPESVSLIHLFSKLESSHQIIDISINGDSFVLKANGVAKWVVLLLLLVVSFNVLGRAIAAIFEGAIKIILNTNLNKPIPHAQTVSYNAEYTCEHCGSTYNPSDYRSGEVMRCGNCKNVIRPKY